MSKDLFCKCPVCGEPLDPEGWCYQCDDVPDHEIDCDAEPDDCPVCGAMVEWVKCWNGCDEGFFDEFETDPVRKYSLTPASNLDRFV